MTTFDHRVLLIKITQDVDENDPVALYEATREWWKVAEKRRVGGDASPEVALAVRNGVVVAAYEIEAWHGPGGPGDDRWAFDGRQSVELGNRYVGSEVSEYYPRGAQNPLRYVL